MVAAAVGGTINGGDDPLRARESNSFDEEEAVPLASSQSQSRSRNRSVGGDSLDDNDDANNNSHSHTLKLRTKNSSSSSNIFYEIWVSKDLIFENRITWLLVLAPFALFGDRTTQRGQSVSFALSGLTLIPCAERLSFVTEQVAEHTNGTIGALLNATFGNAPELLIATAALRSGYYRVVQLAMLGSMLSNLLLVFGCACFVGGLRYQVQDLRITSGNVSVLLLLLATSGSLLPAALFMSGQLPSGLVNNDIPTKEELLFSRVNAFVLIIMYLCYLLFQLGTHKDEFDEDIERDKPPAQRNLFCHGLYNSICSCRSRATTHHSDYGYLKKQKSDSNLFETHSASGDSSLSDRSINDHKLLCEHGSKSVGSADSSVSSNGMLKRKGRKNIVPKSGSVSSKSSGSSSSHINKNINDANHSSLASIHSANSEEQPELSLRAGLIWLFIITLCISSMSDILVETLEGFAKKFRLSGVFTSIIIVPYFSNVAEQVSAILFAYRNEMDLCVGVTVGSAIQIATFVLPGSVLIGMVMDRSMTLFFHGYETCCLFLGVIVVAAILQGGKTNWLVGVCLIGIYVILATGFWIHEKEILNIDAELVIKNVTTTVDVITKTAVPLNNNVTDNGG